jgi:hypothetical protein
MKARIEGKVYDTETSRKIAEYENGYPRTDLDFIREALYRASDGTLFFAGESGPRMRYGKNSEGGGKVGGEGITLTTRGDAKEWIELTQGSNTANANLLLDGIAII